MRARGPVRLRTGDLVLMDEASMVSTPDLADVISHAAVGGAKVILAGDTQQLQAVEGSPAARSPTATCSASRPSPAPG